MKGLFLVCTNLMLVTAMLTAVCTEIEVPVTMSQCQLEGLCEFTHCDCCMLRDGIPRCQLSNGSEFCTYATNATQVPVCNQLNQTFGNPFEMARESCMKSEFMFIKHVGPCLEDEVDADVCSQEGLCEHSGCCCRLHGGVPKCFNKDGSFCPEVFLADKTDEVCADNGKTFKNSRYLAVASCLANVAMKLDHRGPCNGTTKFTNRMLGHPHSTPKYDYRFGLGR